MAFSRPSIGAGDALMPWKPPSHRPAGSRTEAERKAEFDKRRENSYRRGYNSRWVKLRDQVRREEPLCRTCLAQGLTVGTEEIDHIIPHRGNQKLLYSRSNLQGLCKSCHSRKTATEDSSFARTSPPG